MVFRRSASFVLFRIPSYLSTKAQSLESYGEFFNSTNHVFDLQQKTIIRSPNSLLNCEGGRALNQLGDRLSPTTGVPGLPCMRADGTGCAARSFQYSRTVNFRAMATLATALPRRNFNR